MEQTWNRTLGKEINLQRKPEDAMKKGNQKNPRSRHLISNSNGKKRQEKRT